MYPTTIKISVFIFAFALIITFLSSCSSNSSDTIRIGILEGPSTVSFIQMIDQDKSIEGKKVEFIIKKEPIQIQALMMRGELDFAVLPTVMAVNLYNKGLEYRMLACPIWGTLYLLSNNKNIKTLEDIQGQSISIFGQGSTADVLMNREIEKEEIPNVSTDYTYTTNMEVAQALLFKKISAAVVSEPLVSSLLSRDSGIKIVEKIECEAFVNSTQNDIFVQTAFLVSDKFIKKYPSLIPQICDNYSSSCNFANENQSQTAALLVKYNYLPNETIAILSLPLCNIRYVGAFALEQEILQYLNIFYQYSPQSIGGKIPGNDFVYQPF